MKLSRLLRRGAIVMADVEAVAGGPTKTVRRVKNKGVWRILAAFGIWRFLWR